MKLILKNECLLFASRTITTPLPPYTRVYRQHSDSNNGYSSTTVKMEVTLRNNTTASTMTSSQSATTTATPDISYLHRLLWRVGCLLELYIINYTEDLRWITKAPGGVRRAREDSIRRVSADLMDLLVSAGFRITIA